MSHTPDLMTTVASLTNAVERLVSYDFGAQEAKLEKRLGDRIDRLEEKIDRTLTLVSEFAVLNVKTSNAERDLRELKQDKEKIIDQITAMKTRWQIISGFLAIIVAPLSVWAFTEVLKRALS